jgi:hypothetical protein
MSHHYSGPDFGFPHGDARLDLTDLYAFPKPGDASKSILIMNVHPWVGVNPQGPTTDVPFATDAPSGRRECRHTPRTRAAEWRRGQTGHELKGRISWKSKTERQRGHLPPHRQMHRSPKQVPRLIGLRGRQPGSCLESGFVRAVRHDGVAL